jgi:hypothetical protein
MEGAGTLPSFVLDHYESTHYACDTLFDVGDMEHSTIPKSDQAFSLLCIWTGKIAAHRRPASASVPLELTHRALSGRFHDFCGPFGPSQLLSAR